MAGGCGFMCSLCSRRGYTRSILPYPLTSDPDFGWKLQQATQAPSGVETKFTVSCLTAQRCTLPARYLVIETHFQRRFETEPHSLLVSEVPIYWRCHPTLGIALLLSTPSPTEDLQTTTWTPPFHRHLQSTTWPAPKVSKLTDCANGH